MDDFILMEIVHAHGNLSGPGHQLLRRHLLALPEQVKQGAGGAVLHNDAVTWGLSTNTSEIYKNIIIISGFATTHVLVSV